MFRILVSQAHYDIKISGGMGNINLRTSGNVTIKDIATPDGAINVEALGDIEAISSKYFDWAYPQAIVILKCHHGKRCVLVV